jgi:hypothetical protein
VQLPEPLCQPGHDHEWTGYSGTADNCDSCRR